ncbi:MAG: efflux RND transporter periplasmic adaptor subunit [Pleurocapsa sp. MO_226.B13]|nr:efflux RND transporter periplasmic adaptor subunit [Pleurocapsa sp. MO_226.B13]
MKQPPNFNHKQTQPNLATKGKVDNKSLESSGDLESIFLEKAFVSQDLPELVYPTTRSSLTPETALYVAEIDGEFCLLDYTKEPDPTPTPLKPIDSGISQSLSSIVPESNSNLAKTKTNASSSSPFWGKKGLLIGMGLGILMTLGATRLVVAPNTADRQEPELANVTESIAPAQAVTVTEVTTTDINSNLAASGTVTAYEQTPVMSQAAGLQITEILADRGDFVNRGQVLARLNNRALTAQKKEAEAAVAQAEARLDELQAGSRAEEIAQAQARVADAETAVVKAESDLELIQTRVERNRSLWAEGAITRDSFDEVLNQERVAQSDLAGAKAKLREAQQALSQLKAGSRPQTIAQAQAELAQAQGRLQVIEAQLADTVITAPSSGIIASREARVGQIASVSETLFTIIQDGRLELRLKIPETQISQIEPGQKVQISSNANRNLNLTGEVREIDPLIDDSSRQALVKVDLPSSTNLKPGMFLQAAIDTATNQGQTVPIEALLPQSGNMAIAFVVQNDNTVKAQRVTMGEILSAQRVEVIEGLESGDRIVLKGAAYLKDGDRIEISSDK